MQFQSLHLNQPEKKKICVKFMITWPPSLNDGYEIISWNWTPLHSSHDHCQFEIGELCVPVPHHNQQHPRPEGDDHLHHHHHQLLCILLSSVANAPCSFPRLTVMHSKMKDFTPVPLLFNLSYSFKSVRNNNPQHQGLWSSGFSAFSGPIKCLYHSLLSAKIQLAGSFYLLHAGCCEDAEPDLWGLEF